MSLGWQVLPEFRIVQHEKDESVLYKIKNYFGFGDVKINRTDHYGTRKEFRVRGLENLNKIVKFQQLLEQHFSIQKFSQKLQNWPDLEFKDFLKEMQKAKIKLSLSEEAEWLQYFTEQKQKAQTLKSEIDRTDREIDRMVYELYGLTEEEVKIVEGA